MSETHNSQRKHTIVLLMLAVGMFGFAFALVPLYEVFCELTGLNGKTSGRVEVSEPERVDSERTVTVHEPVQHPSVFGEADRLAGGDLLPGFELAVRDVFV